MSQRTMMPQGLRFTIFRRDNFTCRYCGRSSPAVVLHVEHVRPVVRGGTDEPGNLVTSCADCNAGKGATGGVVPPPATAEAEAASVGLVGFYAHELDDEGYASRQFRIVRQLDAERWLVEYFSWLTGEPGEAEPLTEAHLLSSRCVLYGSAEAMVHAYERKLQHPEWRQIG